MGHTHFSKHATLKHLWCGVGAAVGSLSCRMELMKVVGERGVSAGTLDPAPTSTSTGHTSSISGQWVGLDGSSLMCTKGLVLLRVLRGGSFLSKVQLHIKNIYKGTPFKSHSWATKVREGNILCYSLGMAKII